MPLMENPGQRGNEIGEFKETSVHRHQSGIENEGDQNMKKEGGYEDLNHYYNASDKLTDHDTEPATIHHSLSLRNMKAPVLPQRNETRNSRIKDGMMFELQNLDGSTPKETDNHSLLPESNPHELYLSSEEDASFSDDYDDADSLIEFGPSSEEAELSRTPSSRASSRKSQEITARVISIIIVGKPIMVDIPQPSPEREKRRPSIFGESSSPSSPRSTRRPQPLRLYSNSDRRMSVSSLTSLHSNPKSHSRGNLHAVASMSDLSSIIKGNSNTSYITPPRKSSRLGSIVTNAHSFLASDPYATASPEEKEEPKTPTTMAAAAFKKGIQRTLSRARKNSMSRISTAYLTDRRDSTSTLASAEAASQTTSTLNVDIGSHSQPEAKPLVEHKERTQEAKAVSKSDEIAPVQRSVTMPMPSTTKTQTQTQKIPPPPAIPASSPREKWGFGLGRKKSVKTRKMGLAG